jgi:signal transduction histidine kinase/ligand-binding sensor domain-containing protein
MLVYALQLGDHAKYGRALKLRSHLPTALTWLVNYQLWVCVISLFGLFAPSGKATTLPKSLVGPTYVQTVFTVDDGLPDNVVNSITQTQNGLLWIGSGDRLSSFDGRTFTPIQIRIPGFRSPGAINTLLEGRDGDLWVATSTGIVRIPKNDLNDSSTSTSTSFRLGGLGDATVLALSMSSDGTIWAGASDGLYRFDGSQFRCVDSSGAVIQIAQTSSGRLILITSNGVAEYDGEKLIRLSELGADLRVRNDHIFDAYEDPRGTVWYGTIAGIRSFVNGRLQLFGSSVEAHGRTYRFFPGRNGVTWTTTPKSIYALADRNMWTPAPNLEARCFYEGKDGDLWIGTNGSGLVHMHPRLAEMYTKGDGLPTDIAMDVLPAHDGRLWIGMNCGLAVLEGNKFKTFTAKDGLKNTCVWSLAEDRAQNIWLGTYGGGIFRFRSGRFIQYSTTEGLGSTIVSKIVVAQDDSIWAATSKGLSHLQNGLIRNYTVADGLASDNVLDVYQDSRGAIWIATHAGVDMFASGGFRHIPVAKGIHDLLARRFFEDSKGNLYTEDEPDGISQIKNGEVTEFTNKLNAIEMKETPDHRMWFSSTKGLTEISEDDFLHAERSAEPLDYQIFNRADGLRTNQMSVGDPDLAFTPDGKLWIATVEGLAMIDTSRLPLLGKQPPIFVAGATVDGKSHLVGSSLVLPPGTHRVELQLAAVDLANPQRIRLQYRLEGVDSDWLDANAARVAIYTSIPAGRHRMLIRATDSAGHWTPPTVLYEITQRPYFHETLLFRISAVIVLVLLLVLAYRWRVRYLIKRSQMILEERQVEREAIARDLHDTFLQSVQGLILQFHSGTQELAEDDPVRQSFEEALRQSDLVSREGREVLSRLHLGSTRPESLTEAFAALGKEFRLLASVDFDVIVSGNTRELNAVVQGEIIKIGREALFNAFRHAAASRIEVEVDFGITELRVMVRDNGIGIEPVVLREGSAVGHYGLTSMRERCSTLGSTLELWSKPGAGTEIEVRVPASIAYPHPEKAAGSRWPLRRLRRFPSSQSADKS